MTKSINETAAIMQLNLEQHKELVEFLVDNRDPLIGNLMQATEILGLPDSQERAFKRTVKDLVYKKWDWFLEAAYEMMAPEHKRITEIGSTN